MLSDLCVCLSFSLSNASQIATVAVAASAWFAEWLCHRVQTPVRELVRTRLESLRQARDFGEDEPLPTAADNPEESFKEDFEGNMEQVVLE